MVLIRVARIVALIMIMGLIIVWAAPALANVGDLMSRGEKHFRNRMDLTEAEKSAELFRQAIKLNPGDPEPAWKGLAPRLRRSYAVTGIRRR